MTQNQSLIAPDVRQALDNLAQGLTNVTDSLITLFRACVDCFVKVWDAYQVNLVNATTEMIAVLWAKIHHPKWVHYLEHAKKRRTRKKYMNRILRAYKERG